MNELSLEKISKLMLTTAISGVLTRSIVHPFDTIKTKIQVSKHYNNKSIFSLIWNIQNKEGFKSFQKGYLLSVVGSSPALALYLTTYDVSRELFKFHFNQDSFIASFFSGFIAEAISCVLWVPIDVVKERLQVQSDLNLQRYQGTIDAFRQIISRDGIAGLQRGQGATLLSFGPYSGLMFMFNDIISNKLRLQQLNPDILNLLSSAIAGCIACVLTNPLDVAKVRMQVVLSNKRSRVKTGGSKEFVSNPYVYESTLDALFKIQKQEGYQSLFRGGLTRCYFHVPNVAITMSVTQYLKRNFNI